MKNTPTARFRRDDSVSDLRQQIAEAVLPIPDPLRSDREAARASHEDLRDMRVEELWREGERCRVRLAIEDEADIWVRERLARVRVEQQRRKRVAP